MAVSALYYRLELVDAEHDGAWCRTCLLPSGMRIILMATVGPSASLRILRRCGDCGGEEIDAPDADQL